MKKSPFKTLPMPMPSVPIASLPVLTAADLENDIVVQFTVGGIISYRDSFQLLLNNVPVGEKLEIPDPVPDSGTPFSLSIPVSTELKEDGVYTVAYRMTPWIGGAPADSLSLAIRVDRSALPR
jgi:hypothetical protein